MHAKSEFARFRMLKIKTSLFFIL